MHLRRIAALFLVVSVAGLTAAMARPARPQTPPYFTSEKQLYELCGLQPGLKGVPPACEVYIRGVIDYIELNDWAMMRTGRSLQPSWCAEPTLTLDQITRTVLRYLATHAHQGGQPAAASAYLALADGFPCSRKPRPPAPPLDAGQTPPAYTSGQALFESCRSTEAESGPSICNFYIMGVLDDIALQDWTMMSLGRAHRPAWCARSPLVAGQADKIVLSYLVAKPAARREPAAEDVYMALAQAFPCTGAPPARDRWSNT
ncbi:MAG TPA: Rap1a/Tai family immunity protein [Caulobacteraceae bacterium]